MSRIMLYDATDSKGWLTRSWAFGAQLYRTFRALDEIYPVYSWTEALNIIAESEATEVQFWGHGGPGCALIGEEYLNSRSLKPQHSHYQLLTDAAQSMGPSATWWFRTCSTFHGASGKHFGQELAQLMGCRIAAHTHIIGPFQSGLHTLQPGQVPQWSDEEGLGSDGKILMSMPWHKNTINCLVGRIPQGW
jgi:hypothetical protein